VEEGVEEEELAVLAGEGEAEARARSPEGRRAMKRIR
jgi:hypothetical protein